MLPSLRDLCKRFSVSLMTVNGAIGMLAQEELVERAPLKPMFGIVLTDPSGNVRYHYETVPFE